MVSEKAELSLPSCHNDGVFHINGMVGKFTCGVDRPGLERAENIRSLGNKGRCSVILPRFIAGLPRFVMRLPRSGVFGGEFSRCGWM